MVPSLHILSGITEVTILPRGELAKETMLNIEQKWKHFWISEDNPGGAGSVSLTVPLPLDSFCYMINPPYY